MAIALTPCTARRHRGTLFPRRPARLARHRALDTPAQDTLAPARLDIPVRRTPEALDTPALQAPDTKVCCSEYPVPSSTGSASSYSSGYM